MYIIAYRLSQNSLWRCAEFLFRTRDVAEKYIAAKRLPTHEQYKILYVDYTQLQ